MHGQVAGYKSNEQAEVISLPRLKEKNIDYLALGHIHSFSQGRIDDRANYAYSGCLEGRGFDELGDKGFVLLEVNSGQVNAQFVNFSERNLYEYEFYIDEQKSWYETCEEIIAELVNTYQTKSLIKVIVKGSHGTDFYIDKDNLTARLNEIFFFAKVYDKTELKVDASVYENDKSIRGEFVRSVWESDLTAEQKRKIIQCGLSALKGEEI
jgi:DNA repair exonuclease SbcCD nuclease subunit